MRQIASSIVLSTTIVCITILLLNGHVWAAIIIGFIYTVAGGLMIDHKE